MAQQTSLVINDGQATPVAHTFAPNGALARPDGKVVSEWVDRSPGVKVGYYTITEQHAPSNVNGIEKVRFVITRPTLETLSNNTSTGIQPQPTKAFDSIIVIEAWMHDRAGDPELNDLAAFAKNFTASTYFQSKIKTRERTW